MNRALLNPFNSADLPRGVEEILTHEGATTARFNRHGNLLAVASYQGTVTLWDFDARAVATQLNPPCNDGPVTALAFPAPRNGSAVLTAGGMRVRLFDTLSQGMLTELRFSREIRDVVAHPKWSDICVVVPEKGFPIMVRLRRGVYEVEDHVLDGVGDCGKLLWAKRCPERGGCLDGQVRRVQVSEREFGNKIFAEIPASEDAICFRRLCVVDEFQDGLSTEIRKARKKAPFSVAFSRGGAQVMRGGPSGLVRVYQLGERDQFGRNGRDMGALKCISTVCVPGKAAVKAIVVSRKRGHILVNSQDRSVRLLDPVEVLKERQLSDAAPVVLEAMMTFTEIVNKTLCKSVCFSPDGDYVLGGMEGTEHRIHVWRVFDGHLELTLEGAREAVREIVWHPIRGIIVSVGHTGGVYVWARNVTENWSAFATEFCELEANEEYKEKEDEFDVKEAEDEETRLKARQDAEQEAVDVDGGVNNVWFSSDSEEGDSYFYVPAIPMATDNDSPASLSDELIKARREKGTVGEGDDDAVLVGRRKRTREGRKKGRQAKRLKSGKRKSRGDSSFTGERDRPTDNEIEWVDMEKNKGVRDVIGERSIALDDDGDVELVQKVGVDAVGGS